MVTIIPSILAKDLDTFESDFKKVSSFVKKIQVDIVDGKFAPMETVEPEALLNVDTGVDFEGHLMVERPEDWIERCIASGMTALYGQVEKMEDKVRFVADVQAAGMRVGLAYDIDTPLDGLEEMVDNLDVVLLMSVKAGKQGQEFDDRVLEKIKKVRQMSDKVTIMVDGGLDAGSIKKCLIAEWAEEIAEDELDKSFFGMEFVVGSELLLAKDGKQKMEDLENLRDS